ncbi:hypothetical protein B296_00041796 [Ensete ventricosum]|uniref:Uncharacterized protein n=1 Tax=Ensete ventricosum TaxID=4639 RepID=A0A426X693_ENSVE|nr:hypothetical protein B296_00041796 [Ensete ventricosum]
MICSVDKDGDYVSGFPARKYAAEQIPEADLEGVGLVVSAGGEGIDPPLREPRRGLHPACPVAHSRRRCRRDRRGDLIDAVKDSQQLPRVSQLRPSRFFLQSPLLMHQPKEKQSRASKTGGSSSTKAIASTPLEADEAQ